MIKARLIPFVYLIIPMFEHVIFSLFLLGIFKLIRKILDDYLRNSNKHVVVGLIFDGK